MTRGVPKTPGDTPKDTKPDTDIKEQLEKGGDGVIENPTTAPIDVNETDAAKILQDNIELKALLNQLLKNQATGTAPTNVKLPTADEVQKRQSKAKAAGEPFPPELSDIGWICHPGWPPKPENVN